MRFGWWAVLQARWRCEDRSCLVLCGPDRDWRSRLRLGFANDGAVQPAAGRGVRRDGGARWYCVALAVDVGAGRAGGDGEADTGCGWRTMRWKICTRAAHELCSGHACRPQAPRQKEYATSARALVEIGRHNSALACTRRAF